MSDSPPNPGRFQEDVWAVVRQVPHGKVTTYGRVAEKVGPPEGIDEETYRIYGARWVGNAMANSPADVPWQRVVNSQGKVSIRKGSLQLRQRALLEAEGIEFDAHDRINLAVYEWKTDGWTQKTLW